MPALVTSWDAMRLVRKEIGRRSRNRQVLTDGLSEEAAHELEQIDEREGLREGSGVGVQAGFVSRPAGKGPGSCETEQGRGGRAQQAGTRSACQGPP